MYADMICDVMPPIPEDGGGNGSNAEGNGSDNGEEAEANIEQLMVSMLEERDKLQEKLRETEDILNTSQQKLTETEKERDILLRQLSLNAPQENQKFIRKSNFCEIATSVYDAGINYSTTFMSLAGTSFPNICHYKDEYSSIDNESLRNMVFPLHVEMIVLWLINLLRFVSLHNQIQPY
ncbi:unnamed protein product [Rotaria socialis]|uniref:Uncharacterized protein n=3 Tax=Rotaria TaxID=231623 RepID=A0A820T412_9BILA|nr:unnamed protein product [Rotaria socialis]CAF4468848.1 unnamed protein product [Rotaria socialis]